MRLFLMLLVGMIAVVSMVPGPVLAQSKPGTKSTPPKVAPAAPLKDGWEEIDKRLLFLMVRLANVEASLDAVEKKLGVNTRQQAARVGDAKRAELGNEMMDRKGGGPVKWSQFYGRTAEKFFYHPTDRNTTYHTTTVLGQRSPVDDNQVEPGVPSRQGLPVHQRPPQFDYIYKANRDAQARAEQDAAQLRNKVDALQARRRQLEDEQAALWCQIAFRAVTRYDFARKPLFRFEPTPAAGDTASRQQAEAVKAAAIFMRRGLSIVEEAEKDQGKAFGSIKTVIADANEKLDDSLLQLDTLAADTSSQETAIGRFSALARRLKDIADNISDSYEVSIDGDRFKDEVRKDTFRGLLQESLVDYAEVMLAMNEMALLMQSESKTKPDVNTPLKFVSLELPERTVRRTVPVVPQDDIPVPASTQAPQDQRWISLFDGRTLKGWRAKHGGNLRGWQVQNKELILSVVQGEADIATDESFTDFEFRCEFWLDARTNSGLYLRGLYEVQLLDDPSFPNVKAAQRCGSIWNAIAPSVAAYRGPRQWNSLFVRLEGTTVSVVMNGSAIIDQQFIPHPTEPGSQGLADRPGPIVLQSHGSVARFRNIEIRPLNLGRTEVSHHPSNGRVSPARAPVAKGTPLEGEWQSISEELNGRPFNRTNGTRRFKFSGDSMFMSRIEAAYGTYQGSFHVDQESGHFDFNGRRGPSGDPVEFRGIYKIDGDNLVLCYKYVKDDQTTRPVEFRTDDQAGTAFMLIQLKRIR